MIGDLHLLKKKFSKPASSALVAKDGITLQSDGDKLNRWAEHFEEVMNFRLILMSFPVKISPWSLRRLFHQIL